MEKPLPPGERIKEELASRGWTQTDLAVILGRPFPTVNEIISGKKSITPETAVQLGIAFNTGPEIWLQLESQYRLSLVEADASSVERRARLFDLAPVKDMEKRGWIPKTKTADDLEKELKNFFGVVSLHDDPEIAVVARKSASDEPLNSAQRAWCFRAKWLAGSVKTPRFNPTNFDRCIGELRELAAYPEEIRKVSRALSSIGIRLVVVEPLPKTKIDGVAFWLDESSPVIALSLRHGRIDNFWQTLGHELSHIKHRDAPAVDTDIVGQDRPAPGQQSAIELRADREAGAMWIEQKELDDFVVRVGPYYSKARINQFANRIRIHPGIIVGQLQHRGEIGYNSNREMLINVRDLLIAEALTDGWGHTISGTNP